jgi:hypothetical protein
MERAVGRVHHDGVSRRSTASKASACDSLPFGKRLCDGVFDKRCFFRLRGGPGELKIVRHEFNAEFQRQVA